MNEKKNLWDTVNVFRGKFIVVNAYIKKREDAKSPFNFTP